MKKISILMTVAAALILCACSKENREMTPAETGKVSLNVQIDVTSVDPATKAVKAGWESGDVINVWFDKNKGQTPDMTLTYDGSAWKASEVDAAVAANLKAEGNLKFFWIETNDLAGWTYSDGSFSSFRPALGKGFPRLLKPSGIASDNAYQYDAETKTLTATLKWSYATNFQVVVTGLTLADGYTFRCEGKDANMWTASVINVNDDNINMGNGDTFDLGVANKDGVAFNLILVKGGQKTFDFVLRGKDGGESVYSVSKTIDFPIDEAEKNFFAVKVAKSQFGPRTTTQPD